MPMVAKMGDVNAWHFAHLHDKSDNDCDVKKANESGLHKLAKQIIEEHNSISIPPFTLNGTEDPNCNINDPKQVEVYECTRKCDFNYTKVNTEIAQNDFIPDLCLYSTKGKLFVEIAVTHFVDEEKREKIKKSGVSTIEIDLSEFYSHPKTVNDLEGLLLSRTESKKWIYNKKETKHRTKYFPELQARNKELELRFQEEKRRKDKEETEIRNWIEHQKRNKEQINTKVEKAKTDPQLHTTIVNRLHNDKAAEEHFRDTQFYEEAKRRYKGIPFFCNIPVFGEIAFNCDRRIWQMELFDRFFYDNSNGCFTFFDIFEYFYEDWKDKLNDDYVYKKDKKEYYTRTDALGCRLYNYTALDEAIEEYLMHLHELGFLKTEPSKFDSFWNAKKYKIVGKCLEVEQDNLIQLYKNCLNTQDERFVDYFEFIKRFTELSAYYL